MGAKNYARKAAAGSLRKELADPENGSNALRPVKAQGVFKGRQQRDPLRKAPLLKVRLNKEIVIILY